MRDYFEKLYEEEACKWGLKPDFILTHYLDLFPRGTVLDLGMGEGRNALFLAKRGFDVEGIDLSRTAVERCLQMAREKNVNISAHVGDLRKFKIQRDKYSLIIAAGASLNFFKKSEIEGIIAKIKKGVRKEGFVFVSVASIDEPLYRKLRSQQTPIEENTFYISRMDAYVHYFTYDEIKRLFSKFKTIIHLSGLELDFHDKPHYHGMIYYLGKKVKD